MDLSNLATKDNSQEGMWFRLELYGEKHDLWLKILGADADPIVKRNRQILKKVSNSNSKGEMDSETLNELTDDLENSLIRLVAVAAGKDEPDLKEPVELNGEIIQNNEKSFRFLLENVPAIQKFIVKTSNDRANFLGSRKKG